MDSVTIGFSRSKSNLNLISKLIQLVDQTPYSHTYIRFYSETYERNLVYQASSLKVNFVEWTFYNKTEVIVNEFTLFVTPETKKHIIQFAIDKVGTPYGTMEIVGIGLVKLASLFGKKLKNPFRNGNSTYVCSELVSKILIDYLGADIKKDLESMTPKDVYNYLLQTTSP